MERRAIRDSWIRFTHPGYEILFKNEILHFVQNDTFLLSS
jgi:hypothetical protein